MAFYGSLKSRWTIGTLHSFSDCHYPWLLISSLQAVPIGTKLQLRARINPESAWRHIKLLEVAVSPDPDRPHAPGAVLLVKDG